MKKTILSLAVISGFAVAQEVSKCPFKAMVAMCEQEHITEEQKRACEALKNAYEGFNAAFAKQKEAVVTETITLQQEIQKVAEVQEALTDVVSSQKSEA